MTDSSPIRRCRRSIRLQGYDYSQAGAYFVTSCTQGRVCLFGDIADGEMRLNDAGRIVADTWAALPQRFPMINMDDFVIMPNHIHGIIIVGAGLALPSEPPRNLDAPRNRGAASSAPTLGDIVRAFKSISAISVNRLLGRQKHSLWQRNYFEHIIRNDKDLDRIRQYIADNPIRWEIDRENPAATGGPSEETWAQ